MNEDLRIAFKFYELFMSILEQTKMEIKDDFEIKYIYEMLNESKEGKDFVKKIINVFPRINEDNSLDINNMSLDDCITFLNRFISCFDDSLIEYGINNVYDNLIVDMKIEIPFLYKNFSKIISLIKCHNKNYDTGEEYDLGNIPVTTYDETIKIVTAFFEYIDSSNKLKKSFENYLDSGNIYFWNKKDSKIPEKITRLIPNYNMDWGFYDNGCHNFITAPLDNNLTDSIGLVHEFLHYYIRQSNYGDNKILAEFSSIFFENIFAKFLIDIGYKEELINSIMYFRVINHIYLLDSFEKMSEMIIKKKNKDNIKIEDFIILLDEELIINIFPKKYLDEFLKHVKEANREAPQIAKEKMVKQINNLNYKSLSITLSYLIGKVFTDKILEKETNIKEAARKVLAVKDIITNNEMSFHYLLSYFELWDYYFIIENTDTYNPTIPKRIEDKQLVKIKDI